MNKISLGIVISILFCGILIVCYEYHISLFQILIPFFIFLLPFMFISSFKNNFGSFLLATFSILFIYFSFKIGYKYTSIGIFLSFLLGFPIYYFRIKDTKID
jgi:hypothetical protein